MGINYYWHKGPPCKCCGREFKPIHIGKSSLGWCFALHVYPEENILTLNDWKEKFNISGSCIKDEYGMKVELNEMIKTITERSRPHKNTYFEKYCIPGPNNLVRCKVDGEYCIGNGEGTWDYLIGDFT